MLTVQGRLSIALPRRRFMEGEREVEGVAAGVPVSKPEVKSGEYCANASMVVAVGEEEAEDGEGGYGERDECRQGDNVI